MANFNELTLNVPAPKKLGNDVISKTVVVDFSVINDGSGVGAADTVEVLKLPKGAIVTEVYMNVLTAEGGAATMDVGLVTGSATAFQSNLDINAVALTASSSAQVVLAAADTVLITADTASTGAAKVHITVVFGIDETLALA